MNYYNQFHPYRRKQIRRTNYNERFNALSAVQVRTRHFIQLEWARCMDEEECYLKLLLAVVLINEDGNLPDDPMFVIALAHYSTARRRREFLGELDLIFNTVTLDQRVPRPNPVNRNRTFDQLNPRWCYAHTRFRIDHLRRLYHALDLEPIFLMTGRRRVSSEEAFILALVKLATGQTNVDLRDVFGEPSDERIGYIFRHTIHVLDEKCNGILYGNSIERWAHLFETFAEAIANKLNTEPYGFLQFISFRIMGFLDATMKETCTPASGPAEDRPRAPRHPDYDELQEAVYSGYMKIHGLKALTTVFPNGIVPFMYGPISARENDIAAVNMSALNAHLIALQPLVTAARANGMNAHYLSLFGDGIFIPQLCITCKHKAPIGGFLLPRQVEENNAMNSVRTSVEWPYETITNLFHILHAKYNKHLLRRNREVNFTLHAQLRVIFFLYNCYVCLNISKFGEFFDMDPPSLEEYLNVV